LVGLVIVPLFFLQKRKLNEDLTSKTYYQKFSSFSRTHSLPLGSRSVPFAASSFPHTEKAVCIISPDLTRQAWELAEQITSYASNTTVFILVDSVTIEEAQITPSNIFLISTGEKIPKQRGFRLTDGFNIKKEVHGWDKFYYLFASVLLHKYRFVWCLEWDVFVPSRAAFAKLDASASAGSDARIVDFVSMGCWANADGHTHHPPVGNKPPKQDWHWHRVKGRMPPPWYGTMMCVNGLSQRLLERIGAYAAERGRLEFVEIFALTLAMQGNMTVVHPVELQSVQFKHVWTCEDVRGNPFNLFHPVKNRSALVGC